MSTFYKVNRYIKSHEPLVAKLWDQGMALGSIEKRTGIPAARCRKVAQEYFAMVGGNTRPLKETPP